MIKKIFIVLYVMLCASLLHGQTMPDARQVRYNSGASGATDRNIFLKLSETTSVKDFGAVGDGDTDDTEAIQAAIDASDNIFFPPGVYKITYVEIGDKGKTLWGVGNENLYNRASSGISLSEVLELGGTWIYGTSTSSPAISLSATVEGVAGVEIRNLCFFQEHANYAAPTDYPACISDENSTGWYSGITLKNLMLVNCNYGISLTKSERINISDIYMDAFRKGIYISGANDVSKIERVHIWNFAQSDSADDFRQTADSSWGIELHDIDEIFISDVFIWDRAYGIKADHLWGSLTHYTADAVANPLYISNPIGLSSNFSDLKFNCEGTMQSNPAIYIGGAAADAASVIIDGVSIWKGGTYSYGISDGVHVDCSNLICTIQNVNLKYFEKSGIRISDADNVTLNNICSSNYIPNQSAYTLETVGIRNESQHAKIKITNFDTNLLVYVFTGYFNNVNLDAGESLFETKFFASASASSIISQTNDAYVSMSSITGAGGSDWVGARALPYPYMNSKLEASESYIAGVLYDTNAATVTTALDDWRVISLPGVASQEVLIPLELSATDEVKATIIRFTATDTGVFTEGPYARDFTGTIRFYAAFCCKSNRLVAPTIPTSVGASAGAAPSSTVNFWPKGYRYYNYAPSAGGAIGWSCVASGTPGTWKTFGAIAP